MSAADSLKNNLAYLKDVERRLREKKVSSAGFEAECLLKHYGKMDRLDLYTGKKSVAPGAKRAVEGALKKRVKGIPLHYLLKEAHFFGHAFHVTPATLIPRPETEILADEALRLLKSVKRPRILDVGTGSGCLAVSLTIERPDCRMTALDISRKALRIARNNSLRHGLRKKVDFRQSDLFSCFDGTHPEHWDMIVTNPPYIPRNELAGLSREVRAEPQVALDGGKRGLDVIDTILKEAPLFLKGNGWLLMEIGKGQAKPLRERVRELGFWKDLRFVKDHAGIERVLVARKKPSKD